MLIWLKIWYVLQTIFLHSRVKSVWFGKKKKKIPLTRLTIGYSEVMSGLYKTQAHEGVLSIDYPMYST